MADGRKWWRFYIKLSPSSPPPAVDSVTVQYGYEK
jgi:hypothetical protein